MAARWTPGARKRERLHAQLRAEVQARREQRRPLPKPATQQDTGR